MGERHTDRIEYIECPFCGEKDFDLIGLKIHLLRGWCDVFEVTDIGPEKFLLSRATFDNDNP